jgi:hypothetical protein
MHIEFRISERDFRDASMLAVRKRSRMSRLDYYLPYAFTVLWLFASAIPSPLNNYLADGVDLLLTLGVVPILLGFLMLRRKATRVEYKKLRQYHLLQELDLDGMGLRLTTSTGISRSAWQVYSKFAEDKDSFILFELGNHKFLPIPKSYLRESEADELRSLLMARLPAA